ncbi:hypothetical protein HMPREF0742_01200 [Rothia aeria F0184]|uniref:Uncharacterized protein n=1 Tax=Rothia aeria F0184 TaxID=888019 RepID=U7V4V8_9MICC|nr:hypothetical protein HMPREF0742_01200 [Rothia aeria F0184]
MPHVYKFICCTKCSGASPGLYALRVWTYPKLSYKFRLYLSTLHPHFMVVAEKADFVGYLTVYMNIYT